ncbi:MAG: DNA translocase FtsK [Chloroflexi bacterium]|nr:DNA translocase FtsK [Chloroflexota bacterium]
MRNDRLNRLNLQADRIELLLAQHKVSAIVSGGTLTPGAVRFRIALAPGQRLRALQGLADELALALSVPAVRIQRDGSGVQIEAPRDDSQPLSLAGLLDSLRAVPPAAAALGLDADGRPLLLRLSSPAIAHVLIAGTTGSGKSALVRTMLLSLARFNRPRDLRMVLIDPKVRSLDALASLPHNLCKPLSDTVAIGDTLSRLTALMERRDRDGAATPQIVVAIDELADLLQSGGRTVEEPLLRLAQRGRQAGIHLLAATQKPSSAAMSTAIKSNFPVRIVGKVASPEDARIAAGMGGTGADKLGGCGQFVLVAEGRTIRFQAAYASREELRSIVAELASDSLGPYERGQL